MSSLHESVTKLGRRIAWATYRRKTRNLRERSYKSLLACYVKMLDRMWTRIGVAGEDVPVARYCFDKSNATARLYFERRNDGKQSHALLMGDPNQPRKISVLNDITAGIELPYYISDEIIAATVIASIFSEADSADEDAINEILARYYKTEPYDPLQISRVWMSRLNSTVCNIWRIAPIMRRTMELVDERRIKLSVAQKIAMDEVEILEPPTCMNSDNGDGRINMSYSMAGSCFYTIDHHGIAICKEFPNEYLDLEDYEVMLGVAGTIYKDITGCSDDDVGRGGAMAVLGEEPEWMNENLLPWERQNQE